MYCPSLQSTLPSEPGKGKAPVLRALAYTLVSRNTPAQCTCCSDSAPEESEESLSPSNQVAGVHEELRDYGVSLSGSRGRTVSTVLKTIAGVCRAWGCEPPQLAKRCRRWLQASSCQLVVIVVAQDACTAGCYRRCRLTRATRASAFFTYAAAKGCTSTCSMV
jgi:hypothetical protein